MDSRIEERRTLTILFADLSGFTPLASKLDPEEVREAANLCFEHLNKALTLEGGTILKYEGDLVIALFGFPVAHEDDPERAVRASLAMMASLPGINAALSKRLRRKTDLGLHVGVNSGIVVVGEIGSAEKREYTVMGDSVNLTSRLKDAAARGEVLASEPVFRASRYLFDYEVRPAITAKGFEEAVKVFRPLRTKEHPEPKRGIQGLSSPMVGRERELGELKQAFEDLLRGNGGAFFVLGDAGLGKSRLLAEMKKEIASRKAEVALLEGRCLSYSESVPYWPFLQVLGSVFGIMDQDAPEAVKEKILARTKDLLPEGWDEAAPYLGHLFSVRFPDGLDEKIRFLEAKDLKVQTFLAIRKLLAALARGKPLLLVLDDYHWMDPESLELVEFLFASQEPLSLLLVCLARIEKDKECFRAKERFREKLPGRYREITLKPLDESAGTQLAYNLLAIPGITEGFKDRLLAKAAGNPFYLEEIIRSLIDSGVLRFEDGVWRLTADVRTLEIPDTVQAVIAARMDRLEREVRDILQMAAVLGRNFRGRLLEVLCGLDSMMLTLYLATLEEFEFIQEMKDRGESEYAFRHPLSQEVAYESLLKKKRRELHRKAGEAIEALYPDRLEEMAEFLAHQYAHSDDPDKALFWLKKAGRKAKERFANDEALGFFHLLVSLLEEEHDGRERELCEAFEALGEIYWLKGDFGQGLRWFGKMEERCAGDPVLRARARRWMAELQEETGNFAEALRLMEESERALTGASEGELLEKAEVHIMRCWIYRIQGDTDQAMREGETALRILELEIGPAPRELDPQVVLKSRLRILNSIGGVFVVRSEYDKALRQFQTLLSAARESGQKRMMNSALCNSGIVFYETGEYEKAIEQYQAFLALSKEIGDLHGQGTATGNLAIVYQDLGDYDRALKLYGEQERIALEIGSKLSLGMAKGNQGIVYRQRGDAKKAEELFQAYRDLSREIGYKQGIAVASTNLVSVYADAEELDKAEKCFRQAETVLKEIGDRATLSELYSKAVDLRLDAPDRSEASLQEALGFADEAFRLAQEVKSKTTLALAFWTYASVYAALGDAPKCEENFKKAIEAFAEMKQKRALADASLEYAQFLKKKGAPAAEMGEHLSRARGIYEELKLPQKAKECEI